MSEKKTLGQVYFEAYDKAPPGEHMASGIAAVCRAVMAERDKSTEFALRAMQIPRVIAAARQAMEREAPKPDAASEAGDWAMEAANWAVTLYETTGIVTASEIASRIRESADRHYGPRITDLQGLILGIAGVAEVETTVGDAREFAKAAVRSITALKNSSKVEHTKRLADRLDAGTERNVRLQGYLIALADVVGASYPSPMTDATFAANIMAATIKTVQERGAAVAECERLRTELLKLGASKHPAAAPSPAADETGEDELRKASPDAARLEEIAASRPPREWVESVIAQPVGNERWMSVLGETYREIVGDMDIVEYAKNLDDMIESIRPLFDAVRAERDRAIEADRTAVKGQLPVVCTKCFYTPGTNRSKYCGDGGDKDNGHRWTKVEELVKRAEAAEAERDKLAAELCEVREAIAWAKKENCDPSFNISDGKWYSLWIGGGRYGIDAASYLDAILTAFRATKGKEQADGPK